MSESTVPTSRARRAVAAPLLAMLLGLSLSQALPSRAAERVAFVSGAFRRSIPVADLEHLAETGQARGLLADVLRFSNQDPETVSGLLNQGISLPLVLTSRLMNTRIGTAIIERVAQIVYPLNSPRSGVPAFRAAVILGLDNGEGRLTPVGWLKAYPTDDMEVNIPALMGVIRKASSIAELVRFFSESPLDGLRGGIESPDSSSGTDAGPGPDAASDPEGSAP
ncbi:alpha/beta hydrolase [Synechococcus sp. RSCCF101]|uniref:alpha/beta hydrolase n=1 Tax=Synechococcus sp. RSCCF101 TaxID=2511069 RepID=UPI00351A71D8